MRNPNGYGAIIRLGGKRRKPFAVRITTAYALDPDSRRVIQRYKYLGYYSKRAEAMQALAEYNADPYDPNVAGMNLTQIYDRWLPTREGQVSAQQMYNYQRAMEIFSPVALMPLRSVRLVHLQRVFDDSGKTDGTLLIARGVLSQLYEWAIKNDICEKNYAKYIDLSRARKSRENPHATFTQEDIDALWKLAGTHEPATVILMLIYSGVRVGELLELKKENLNLAERWFEVTHSKTAAGLRRVPIAKKTLPFFERWAQKNGSPYVLTNRQGKPYIYQSYLKWDWTETLRRIGLESHRPHDTRHTCISLLSMAQVQPELIRAIVGHRGQSLTEDVYTHFDFQLALDAIDKI